MLNINFWKAAVIIYITYYIVSRADWFILNYTQKMMAARKRANQNRIGNERKKKNISNNVIIQKRFFGISLIKLSSIFVDFLFRSLHCHHLSRYIAGASFNFITGLNHKIYRDGRRGYFHHSRFMKYIGRPAAHLTITYFRLQFPCNS